MSDVAQHRWDVSVAEAVAIQQRLAPLAAAAPPIALDAVRYVAGVNVSYADRARRAETGRPSAETLPGRSPGAN